MNNRDGNPNMQQSVIERRYGFINFIVLSSAMWLSLATWAALVDVAKGGEWKSIIDVAVTLFLAVASLTRHPRSAITFRLLTGGWLASTPYLLGIWDIEAAAVASLTIGILLIAVSVAEMVGVPARRAGGSTYHGEPRTDVAG